MSVQCSLKLCVLSSRFRPEHAHAQHTQSSINISSEFPWVPKWQRFIDVFILSHWGDRGHGPFAASHPSHPPSHPPGVQAPEGAGPHRPAARPLHDPDLLLPAYQPAVPLCPRVPPLVQPGLGPAPLEDYSPDRRDNQRGQGSQSADPQALSGYSQRMSHVGDGNC